MKPRSYSVRILVERTGAWFYPLPRFLTEHEAHAYGFQLHLDWGSRIGAYEIVERQVPASFTIARDRLYKFVAGQEPRLIRGFAA